jgi:hypothetical protein
MSNDKRNTTINKSSNNKRNATINQLNDDDDESNGRDNRRTGEERDNERRWKRDNERLRMIEHYFFCCWLVGNRYKFYAICSDNNSRASF